MCLLSWNRGETENQLINLQLNNLFLIFVTLVIHHHVEQMQFVKSAMVLDLARACLNMQGIHILDVDQNVFLTLIVTDKEHVLETSV